MNYREKFSVPERFFMWIDGQEMPSSKDEWFPVVNPSNGELICEAARGKSTDVDHAVTRAKKALVEWLNIPNSDKGRILRGVGDLLRDNVDRIAVIETLNCGKPLRDAQKDVLKSAETFDFYSGVTDKIFGKTIPLSDEYVDYTIREPVGVTAHISPWNYPLRLSVRSVAPALAAGNTVVLKPAEETPLSVILLGKLMTEAGIPEGVYNVVTGYGPEAGSALASHPDINHLSFTGSVETGIEVMQHAARNVVPLTLELGGKSPNIVFADADIDSALEGAFKAMFANAGQVCCAGSRLLLEEEIYDSFTEQLLERVQKIQLGPGIENPDMGPLISNTQRERVLEYIRIGGQEGAELLIGGGIPENSACKNGFFVEPTLIGNVENQMTVAQDEIFGPVLSIIRFHDEDEAIHLANESQYGLVAGVWTSSLSRAHKMAAAIEAGQIYINDFFSGSVACPFGGYKKSGFGRERGLEALEHYTQVKNVCIKLEK